jgi:thiamine-monophosphate kinase
VRANTHLSYHFRMSGTIRPPSRTPSEFGLIARYFAPLARSCPGAYGLLDDAAVLSPSSDTELVVKTDTIVAGVDFPPDAAPDLIARKALRVNLSDLAAKGAQPRAYLVDLVLPPGIDEAWIAAFAAGLSADQNEYGVSLIGGDMSSTSGPVVVAVTALGEAPVGRIIRRGGAQAGDLIFVTGTIGDASLGLRVLRGSIPALDADSAAFLLQRYRLPQPRVSLGPQLIGIATASIDVSDGLVADLRHLCSVCSLDAIVEAHAVPLSSAARAAIGNDVRTLAAALTGGDDYELLFTAPQAALDRLNALSRSTGVPLTRIGEVKTPPAASEPRVLVLDAQRRPLEFVSEGWTHFGVQGSESPAA